MEQSRNTTSHRKIGDFLYRNCRGVKLYAADWLKIGVLGVLITLGIVVLFYNHGLGCLVGIFVMPLTGIYYIQKKNKQRKEVLKREFREVLMALANSLSAGISVENAFVEAEKNLHLLYGKEGVLERELFHLNQKVLMGVAVEKQFFLLAEKINLEEMLTFAELFLYAKRMGGDYTKNIRRIALRMDEAIGLKEDMEGQMAEKLLELKIMACVPIGILVYLRIWAADFLAPMYGSFYGSIAMTGCLLLYVGSVLLGVYIVRKTLEG